LRPETISETFSFSGRKRSAAHYINVEVRMERILSTGQVAQLLGIQGYQITYAIKTRQLDEPRFRFLDKRCFTQEDIKRIALHFGIGRLETEAELIERMRNEEVPETTE